MMDQGASMVTEQPYPGATDAAIAAAQGGREVKQPRWGVPDYLIALATWLLVSTLVGIPLMTATDPSPAYAWLLVVSMVVPWLGTGGYPWLISRLRGNGVVLDFGLRFTRRDALWGLLYGVVAFLLVSGLAVVTETLAGEVDSNAGEASASLADYPIQRLLFAVATAIGAPFFEEVCYRGLLQTSLLKRGLSQWLSLIITAALFAATHFEPVRFAMLFALGLVLGLARAHRNNIGTSIVAHIVNNLSGGIAILFMLNA